MAVYFPIPWNEQVAINIGGQGGVGANSCTASTSIVAIGAGEGRLVVGSHARRAWLHIQRAAVESTDLATNTPALFFGSWTHNTDTLATSGYRISTTTNPAILGLNTDLPYTGSLYALTDNGSTTIRVTECRY